MFLILFHYAALKHMRNSFVYCIMLINLISDFQLLVFYKQQNTLLWVKTIRYGRDPNNVYNLFSVELNIKQVPIILRIFDFIIIFVHSSSLLYIYHCFYSQWIFNNRLISFCWGEAKEGGVEKLHFLVYLVMKLYYLGFTEKCSAFVWKVWRAGFGWEMPGIGCEEGWGQRVADCPLRGSYRSAETDWWLPWSWASWETLLKLWCCLHSSSKSANYVRYSLFLVISIFFKYLMEEIFLCKAGRDHWLK